MSASPRRRGRASAPVRLPQVGLALAGGGPAGAVYEIGALRALEEAIEGLDLNELACYTGVSAGAFISSCLANGLTVTQMARALLSHEAREHPFHPDVFFTPAYREWLLRAAKVPRLVLDAISDLASAGDERSLVAALSRMSRALPVALFDNEPIRRYLEFMFSQPGRTNDFRRLQRDLVIVAADLGTGQALRFGEPGLDHVPIARAVQASTALPGIYPPVPIEGHDCVDGVLLKTMHASVLLERGITLAICINPIVPVDVAPAERAGTFARHELVTRGLPAILSQTFRTLIHSRLQTGVAAYAERFPDAHVLLLEPERDEYEMFFANMFSFSSRRRTCEIAWRATRHTLLQRADEIEPVLARHGLTLRRDVLTDESLGLWSGLSREPSDVRASAMDSGASARLSSVLDDLERAALPVAD
jgi:NTE family protein